VRVATVLLCCVSVQMSLFGDVTVRLVREKEPVDMLIQQVTPQRVARESFLLVKSARNFDVAS